MNKIISIATDFSRYPAGRTRADGPYSGELFRTKMLEPALAAGDHLVVNFDGARGYGSSFLEEAFGGLVRAGFSVETINTLLSFESSDPSLIEEVTEYIEDASLP